MTKRIGALQKLPITTMKRVSEVLRINPNRHFLFLAVSATIEVLTNVQQFGNDAHRVAWDVLRQLPQFSTPTYQAWTELDFRVHGDVPNAEIEVDEWLIALYEQALQLQQPCPPGSSLHSCLEMLKRLYGPPPNGQSNQEYLNEFAFIRLNRDASALRLAQTLTAKSRYTLVFSVTETSPSILTQLKVQISDLSYSYIVDQINRLQLKETLTVADLSKVLKFFPYNAVIVIVKQVCIIFFLFSYFRL